MPVKDKKKVNLSEDYELNRHLRSKNKRQTQENRDIVKDIAQDTKKRLDKRMLNHEDLSKALEKNKNKLE